jgi:hypothetical protein
MSRATIRREWLMVILVAALATAVMQIPYILGYALARPGTVYTGNLINVEDFSYQAIMLQGYNGAWQYHGQFTSEEHVSAFLYVFYLALGHVARLSGLSVVGMWHVSRVAASFLLILATFGFVSSFLQDRSQRWVAFLLAVFGSGFDWALFPWEKFDIVGGAPVDFRMPEAHLFFSALTYPHFAVGISLLLFTFWFALKALERREPRYAAIAGIGNVMLVLIYPFLVFLVLAVLGAYWLLLTWRAHHIAWREVFIFGIAFGLPAPLLAYYAHVLQVNPVYRAWNEQVVTLSPNPLHYALAYGMTIVLGVVGWRFRWTARLSAEHMTGGLSAGTGEVVGNESPTLSPLTRGSERGMGRSDNQLLDGDTSRQLDFLVVWVVVVLALLYAPLNMQRRFVEGLQVPLSILATAGLMQVVMPWVQQTRLFQRLARRRRYTLDGFARLTVVMFLLLMSAANLVVVLQLSFQTALAQPSAFFRSTSEIEAVGWLRDHAANSDVTLAAYWTGAIIPAWAGSAVFVGQRYETIEFADKLNKVEQFFGNQVDDAWRRDLLSDYHVTYVWWGPRERGLGNFDPNKAAYLQMAFANSDVTLFKFLNAGQSSPTSLGLPCLRARTLALLGYR